MSYNNSYTLYIVFIKQPSCEEKENETPIASWIIILIVIGSVLGLVIIFIVIVLLIPSLREKILPYRESRDKRQEVKKELNK